MVTSRTYIIAEAGVNHNGSIHFARRLIDEARKAGADAVKFQAFHSEDLVTKATPQAVYQRRDRTGDSTQWTMLKKLELNESEQKELSLHARRRGIEFLATPFDLRSLNFLVQIGVKKIKISSGDLTNGPLLLAAARTKLPVILSTGMATLREIENALAVLAFGYRHPGIELKSLLQAKRLFRSRASKILLRRKVCLLQCTTEYPAPNGEINLRAMDVMRTRFDCAIGLSDHSTGIVAPIAAVSCGAAVIEKHFTLSKRMKGPDHRASLEPAEFSAMVRAVRAAEEMLGGDGKKPAKSEIKNMPLVRRTLVAAQPIFRGDLFTEKNITAKRAGEGLSPMFFWSLLGKRAKRNYLTDEKVNL